MVWVCDGTCMNGIKCVAWKLSPRKSVHDWVTYMVTGDQKSSGDIIWSAWNLHNYY